MIYVIIYFMDLWHKYVPRLNVWYNGDLSYSLCCEKWLVFLNIAYSSPIISSRIRLYFMGLRFIQNVDFKFIFLKLMKTLSVMMVNRLFVP